MDKENQTEALSGQGTDTYINQEYKDRVIRKLFGESKENALSLYNAVNNSAYTNPDELEFNTIDDAIYMGMKNDFSFLFCTDLNFYEHQSTWNPNMPVRGFIYLARIWDGYIHKKRLNILGSRLQKLPTPHYIVLYNGEKDMPDRQTLRLSDAFETPGGCAELLAEVYNINYGRNAELMEKCEPLRGYAILVDKIRHYRKDGMTTRQAVDCAVNECIAEGILESFLTKHKAEVVGMFLTEYNEAEHIRMEKEESLEEGIEIGEKLGEKRGIEIGEKRGIEIGEKRGIEIGEKRGIEIAEKRAASNMAASIQNLVRNLGITVDAAISALGIPAEDRQKYASLVSQQGMPDT